jgi:P-loop Domain of unknown function (DUF2791)
MAVDERRAIESLRAGVPSGPAVKFLGSKQEAIISRFRSGIQNIAQENKSNTEGFILGGEFGSGKSHMLEFLRQEGIKQNFAVSSITISKETPLSDLDLVYKAAIKELHLPDRRSGDLSEVVLKADQKSERYRDFVESVEDGILKVGPLFESTLHVHRRLENLDPFINEIEQFWSGGRISIAEIKQHLRQKI